MILVCKAVSRDPRQKLKMCLRSQIDLKQKHLLLWEERRQNYPNSYYDNDQLFTPYRRTKILLRVRVYTAGSQTDRKGEERTGGWLRSSLFLQCNFKGVEWDPKLRSKLGKNG